MYSNSFLGQIWQVLTPLLNAAVYYLVFGYLLYTKHNIPNYIGFLTIGIFFFSYMQNSIINGARSVSSNLAHHQSAALPPRQPAARHHRDGLSAAARLVGRAAADRASHRRAACGGPGCCSSPS